MGFHGAEWVRAGACEGPYLMRTFRMDAGETASIDICGLGLFQLQVNGRRVSDAVRMPVWTDYGDRGGRRLLYPLRDRFSHRIPYVRLDLTPFVRSGENVLLVLLGNGWYNQRSRKIEGDLWYGLPRLMFDLSLTGVSGTRHVVSDGSVQWCESRLVGNNVYLGEVQDLSGPDLKSMATPPDAASGIVRGEAVWKPVTVIEPVEGSDRGRGRRGRGSERAAPVSSGGEPSLCGVPFFLQTCPMDARIREVPVRPVAGTAEGRIYDCGENLTGWVRLSYRGAPDGTVRVRHAEEVLRDAGGGIRGLDFASCGGEAQIQQDEYRHVPVGAVLEPVFTLHGFRWFEVAGDAEPEAAVVIHADVAPVSDFRCDVPVADWLFGATRRTYLGNLHDGVPSDCPHRERLGYTGDGQLMCGTGLLLADTEALYRKWLCDIADGQDPATGHVQHTAPFYGGGGGPGGWGCAIVEVPWQLWLHAGDRGVLEAYWPNMRKYAAYLASRSVNGLVVAEEKDGWCLGDWCAPRETKIPEPFVNTYFHIRSLMRMQGIACVLARPFPLREQLAAARQALVDTYFDEGANTFCGGIQGADAFALDIGLGDARMADALAARYDAAGVFDTGIFGTDILLDVLFRTGHADTAWRLMTAEAYPSFGHMMRQGATTLWEDWEGANSHNHPMFGACVRQLFGRVLGIRQADGGAGYRDVIIEPCFPAGLNQAEGRLKTPVGEIAVAWRRVPRENGKGGHILATVQIPEDVSAAFRHGRLVMPLSPGRREIRLEPATGMMR